MRSPGPRFGLHTLSGRNAQLLACIEVWEARRRAGLSVGEVRLMLGSPGRRIGDYPIEVLEVVHQALLRLPARVYLADVEELGPKRPDGRRTPTIPGHRTLSRG